MVKFRLIFCITLLLFYEPSISVAKTISKSGNSRVITTKIRSNFIDITRQNNIVYFSDKVVLEREDLSILSDKMVVYYNDKQSKTNSSNNSGNQPSIKKVTANDNVKIFNQEFVATGSEAIYNPQKNTIILEKNVIFNNGTSIANGQKFVYDLTTKKGYLIGSEPNHKKDDEQNISNKNDNSKEDNRVIVIIEDNDIKTKKE